MRRPGKQPAVSARSCPTICYGDNCSAKAIERDAGIIADLSGPHANRPFQVIDDGW